MTTENLKSTPITSLDATPTVPSTVGEGAAGPIRSVSGTVTITSGDLATSTYQLARVPSNAKLKHAYVGVDVTVTTFTCDIGFYYSTSTVDGTPAAKQGTAVNTTSGSQLLGAGVDLKTAGFVDYIKTLAGAKRNKALWDACGLTSDPGGFFDLTLTNTATNNGAAVVTGECQYVV